MSPAELEAGPNGSHVASTRHDRSPASSRARARESGGICPGTWATCSRVSRTRDRRGILPGVDAKSTRPADFVARRVVGERTREGVMALTVPPSPDWLRGLDVLNTTRRQKSTGLTSADEQHGFESERDLADGRVPSSAAPRACRGRVGSLQSCGSWPTVGNSMSLGPHCTPVRRDDSP